MSKRARAILRETTRAVLGAVALALLVRAVVGEPFRVPSGSMLPTLVVGDVIVVNKLAYGPRIPFTSRRMVRFGVPARGDVIVFSTPREPRREVARRVVGLPGDVVEIREGAVWVNGVPQGLEAAGELTYEERNESTGKWWKDTCALFREALARGEIPRPLDQSPSAVESSRAAAAARGLVTHRVLQCRRARPLPSEGPFQTVAPGHVFVLGDNRDRSADSRSDSGWQVPYGDIAGRATFIGWSWGRGGAPAFRGVGVRFDRLFKRIE